MWHILCFRVVLTHDCQGSMFEFSVPDACSARCVANTNGQNCINACLQLFPSLQSIRSGASPARRALRIILQALSVEAHHGVRRCCWLRSILCATVIVSGICLVIWHSFRVSGKTARAATVNKAAAHAPGVFLAIVWARCTCAGCNKRFCGSTAKQRQIGVVPSCARVVYFQAK